MYEKVSLFAMTGRKVWVDIMHLLTIYVKHELKTLALPLDFELSQIRIISPLPTGHPVNKSCLLVTPKCVSVFIPPSTFHLVPIRMCIKEDNFPSSSFYWVNECQWANEMKWSEVIQNISIRILNLYMGIHTSWLIVLYQFLLLSSFTWLKMKWSGCEVWREEKGSQIRGKYWQ